MAAVTALAWDTGYEVAEADIANLALGRLGAELIADTTESSTPIRQAMAVFAATRDELLRDYEFTFAKRTIYLEEDEGTDHTSIGVTLGSASLTGFSGLVASAQIGMLVEGTGIPDGSIVVSNTTNTVVIDKEATASGTVTVTISTPLGKWAYAYIVPTTPVILRILEIDHSETEEFEIARYGSNKRLLCDIATVDGIVEIKYIEQNIDPAAWDALFKAAFVLRIAAKMCMPLTKNAGLLQYLNGEFSAIYQTAKSASGRDQISDAGEAFWTER